MAHHKSAIKKIRKDVKRTAQNKAQRTQVKNAIKKVRKALDEGNLDVAKKMYSEMVPVVDKMARIGIMHQNTAARAKSRLNQRIRTLATSVEK
ncbi:30S ribosomal protein S20 [bacterium]|nr:30S ribosomal protein S20 [candidate division CSSED10-310 bacterium]